MKYSDYFLLPDREQVHLDFFNGLTEQDSPLFIDPALIELESDDWFQEAHDTIKSFFDYIFQLHHEGHFKKAEDLLQHGSEPNETRLGLSTGKPLGRGTSQKGLSEIFRNIERDGLLDEGLITSHMDLPIFVENFAEDRMSDLITNIIRGHLVDYTIDQSIKHNLPLTEQVQEIGMTWNKDKLEWEMVSNLVLLVCNSSLLLIPKYIVVKRYLHSTNNYLNRTVFEWRQEYHKDNGTFLARRIPLKDGPGVEIREPSKKEVREAEIKQKNLTEKEYVIEQSKEKTTLIIDFHKSARLGFDSSWTNRLTNEDLEEVVDEVIAKKVKD